MDIINYTSLFMEHNALYIFHHCFFNRRKNCNQARRRSSISCAAEYEVRWKRLGATPSRYFSNIKT